MRVTSELFISALIRRIAAAGGFGAVIRRGNGEAGAVYLVHRERDGAMTLYGPAPQAVFAEGAADRRFAPLAERLDPARLEGWMEREARFDSDFWLVEIEPGAIPVGELVTLTGTGRTA
jgi:hypothetical protein